MQIFEREVAMTGIRLKIAALTRGKNSPSARFRIRQLIPTLKNFGIEMKEFIPLVPSYPPRQHFLRPLWIPTIISTRVPAVLATHLYDLTVLQRELISTFYTFEPLIKHPVIFDVDDAIFSHKRGWIAKKIAKQSDLIICGNDFLANVFAQWNSRVEVIPTAVDTSRFVPAKKEEKTRNIIGWIGTSSNFKYLYQIEKPLSDVFKARSDVHLRIISDMAPKFRMIKEECVEYIKWSPEIEVTGIQQMTIGIMPLEDSVWTRGKCSYKMLQYMACGIPVVVSPVGMNIQVLSMGEVGIGARSQKEWKEALLELLSVTKRREQMGKNGRAICNEHFCVNKIVGHLANCMQRYAK